MHGAFGGTFEYCLDARAEFNATSNRDSDLKLRTVQRR